MTIVEQVLQLVRKVANTRGLPRLSSRELRVLEIVHNAQTISLYHLERRTTATDTTDLVMGLVKRGLLRVEEVGPGYHRRYTHHHHPKNEARLNAHVYLTCLGHEVIGYAIATARVA